MMIGITMIPESERISPVFEAARHLRLTGGRPCRADNGIEHVLPESVGEKIDFLAANGVGLLICGAIANETVALLNRRGVAVRSFVSGNWREILLEWQNCRRIGDGHLMPGCCRQHRRGCRNFAPADHELRSPSPDGDAPVPS